MPNTQTSFTQSKTIQPLIISLIGCKYLAGGLDRNGFDCWGLVWYFYNELGIKTPKPSEYLTRTTNISKHETTEKIKGKYLKEVKDPKDFCVVSFKRGDFAIHTGVYFPELKSVLHCVGNAGVVFENLKRAETTRSIKGTFLEWL
jgi:hypothetical protein